MRKFLLSLTLAAGTTCLAAGAYAAPWHSPEPLSPQPVQYYGGGERGYRGPGGPGGYDGYRREPRHEEWRRHEAYEHWRRHQEWRRWRHARD